MAKKKCNVAVVRRTVVIVSEPKPNTGCLVIIVAFIATAIAGCCHVW